MPLKICSNNSLTGRLGRARRQVLVIEDEYLVGVLVGDMLSELGHELFAIAGRLNEALELARQGSFDLGLLDLTLGGVPSYPVADLLRTRGVPFAFVTGRLSTEVAPGYRDIPILQKPFRIDDLAATIVLLMK